MMVFQGCWVVLCRARVLTSTKEQAKMENVAVPHKTRILCLSAPIYSFDPCGKLRGFSIQRRLISYILEFSFCAACLGSKHSHDRTWRFVMHVFESFLIKMPNLCNEVFGMFSYGSIFSPQSLWGRVGQCFALRVGELGFVRECEANKSCLPTNFGVRIRRKCCA